MRCYASYCGDAYHLLQAKDTADAILETSLYTVSWKGKVCCPHFSEEATEAQRHGAGCPKSPSQRSAEGGFGPTDRSPPSPPVSITGAEPYRLASTGPHHVLGGSDPEDQKAHASEAPADGTGERGPGAAVPCWSPVTPGRQGCRWSTSSAAGARCSDCPPGTMPQLGFCIRMKQSHQQGPPVQLRLGREALKCCVTALPGRCSHGAWREAALCPLGASAPQRLCPGVPCMAGRESLGGLSFGDIHKALRRVLPPSEHGAFYLSPLHPRSRQDKHSCVHPVSAGPSSPPQTLTCLRSPSWAASSPPRDAGLSLAPGLPQAWLGTLRVGFDHGPGHPPLPLAQSSSVRRGL